MNIIKHLVFRGCLLLAALMLALAGQVWAMTPNCPRSFTLAADGSKCVLETTPSCRAGFTWSNGACQGTDTATVVCPADMSYSAWEKKCVSLIEPTGCPNNYTYSTMKKKCQKLEAPGCPSGFHWDTQVHSCKKTTRIAPICQGGSHYNTNKKVCERFAPLLKP
jgi:hypothetical protein